MSNQFAFLCFGDSLVDIRISCFCSAKCRSCSEGNVDGDCPQDQGVGYNPVAYYFIRLMLCSAYYEFVGHNTWLQLFKSWIVVSTG